MSRHPESPRRSCRRRFATLAVAGAAVWVAIIMAGCGSLDSGSAGPSLTDDASAVTPTVTATVHGSTETAVSTDRPSSGPSGTAVADPATDVPAGVRPVFVALCEALRPLPVYAPTQLPGGAVLAGEWWPVAEADSPSDYKGRSTDNPKIDSVEGNAVSAQVVLEVGAGWLVFFENFRGDLGDVQGKEVGLVQGNRVRAYELQGGTLAQWSDGGCWFAVFGRNLDAAVVVATALRCVELAPAPGPSN